MIAANEEHQLGLDPCGQHERLSAGAPAAIRRALVIAYDFPPLTSAGVFRTLRFARYLPEFGWRPIVLCVDPTAAADRCDPELLSQVPPETEIRRTRYVCPERWLTRKLTRETDLQAAAAPSPGTVPEVNHRSVSEGAPGTVPIRDWLRKVRDLVFFTPDERVWWVPNAIRDGLRAIRNVDPHVIYTTGPPHSTHLAGLVLRRLTGRPWIADFRDPWSRQPWGMKSVNPWGQRLLPLIEAQCMHYASTVILNTPRMADEFRDHYRSERGSKFVALPNGFDPGMRRAIEELLDATRTDGVTSGVRLCHAGSLYARRNIDLLLAAMRMLVDRGLDVSFEQVGPCQNPAEVRELIRRFDLESHVLLAGTVPHREALRRMAASDVLVVIQPENALQVPGKLYEMMLFGKPILALVDEGAVADIVRKHDLGEVSGSLDAARIASSIERLTHRAKSAGDAHSQHVTALNEYDGRALSGRLAGIFDDVVTRFGSLALPAPEPNHALNGH